jgi:hypothetical protein
MRACDDTVDELQGQHARGIAKLEDAAEAKEISLQKVKA